jgi:hypothetical protein
MQMETLLLKAQATLPRLQKFSIASKASRA